MVEREEVQRRTTERTEAEPWEARTTHWEEEVVEAAHHSTTEAMRAWQRRDEAAAREQRGRQPLPSSWIEAMRAVQEVEAVVRCFEAAFASAC